jgi:hypothetical protein
MPTGIATVIFAVGVLRLFMLDRDRNMRTSKELWIPVFWVSLTGSRRVSQWLGFAAPLESSAQTLDGNPLDRDILAGLIAADVIVLLEKDEKSECFREQITCYAFYFGEL